MDETEFDALFPQGWLDDQVTRTVESMRHWPKELHPNPTNKEK